jgi:hypothetical protein
MAIVGIFNLCGPAMMYLVVSVTLYALILMQNIGNYDVYCVGNYFCKSSNIYAVFIIKALYILIWTWILNILCSTGLGWLSWLLVIIPFIVFFILILVYMGNNS